MTPPAHTSQITFLYFQNLKAPARFFEEILQFQPVDDQGFAKIYRAAEGAFIGIVDDRHGHHKPKDESAVLISLTAEDVTGWHDYLKERGVKILAPVKIHEQAHVESCFFEGPGGYSFEIQRFLNPDTARLF